MPSPLPPVEARRIILHPQIVTGPGILFWENEPKLLPGGKYVLFQNWGHLDCWNVFEDTLVWTHACSMYRATVLAFASELTEDDQAVVLTCQRTWEDLRKNFIEVTTLDLDSGISSLLLVSRVPDSSADNPYSGCAVCGDIVAVEFSQLRKVLLINWRTASCVVILTSNFSLCRIALVPGYFMLTVCNPRGRHQLACSPLPPPASWAPIDGVHEPPSEPRLEPGVFWAKDLPTSFTDKIVVAGRSVLHVARQELAVFESPLQRERFRLWLHVAANGAAALYSYEFVIRGREAGVSGRRRSRVPATDFVLSSVSFSGYMIGGPEVAILPPIAREDRDAEPRRINILQLIDLVDRGDFIHLSPYSGAVTYATSQFVVVVYYN
ncbi:hypothetical protein C8R44DRAFT_71646 [Mycena epipterygia]|nr:hypothetical protein C8R44DRAFT_71646 [Mycena epipterygia]